MYTHTHYSATPRVRVWVVGVSVNSGCECETSGSGSSECVTTTHTQTRTTHLESDRKQSDKPRDAVTGDSRAVRPRNSSICNAALEALKLSTEMLFRPVADKLLTAAVTLPISTPDRFKAILLGAAGGRSVPLENEPVSLVRALIRVLAACANPELPARCWALSRLETRGGRHRPRKPIVLPHVQRVEAQPGSQVVAWAALSEGIAFHLLRVLIGLAPDRRPFWPRYREVSQL